MAQETLDVTLGELVRLARGIERHELDRLKARIKSALVMQQESSSARSSSMARDWYLLGRVRTLDEIEKEVDALSAGAINEYLKQNPPRDFTIVTLGSKEGLANLAQAITSPGDTVLVPNPSYPIHPYGFIIAGGSVTHIPVPGSTSLAEFLPALERAVKHAVPKPIALVLNYPSNPTAQVVDLDFYSAIVDFCKRQGIWILSDLAYAEIYFDGVPPEAWAFPVGGYQPAQKWLKDRKGRALSSDELSHYPRIIAALLAKRLGGRRVAALAQGVATWQVKAMNRKPVP